MKKRCLLCIGVFVLCMICVSSQVYVQHGNLWDIFLCQNAEHLLLLFKNGDLLVFTENLEKTVIMPWYLFDEGRKVEDLLIVIHNHLNIARWSPNDKAIYGRLRAMGFRGEFGLRLGSGTTIWMSAKEE